MKIDEKGRLETLDTKIEGLPDKWYKVTVHIDVPNQRWDLFVNKTRFKGGPIPFGMKLESLHTISYHSVTPPGGYIDAVTIGPPGSRTE
jgi:hypothetical protein